MSTLCGKPTPTGPCQRPVTIAGGPCGVPHSAQLSPAGTAVPAVPPPDPLGDGALPASWPARERLAADPATSPHALDALADDDRSHTRIKVAANSSAFPATLARMTAKHPHITRGQLFGEPGLPCRPATDDDVAVHRQVRTNLAANPATPPETLEVLARDIWNVVRVQAAQNPATPASSLNRMTRDAVDSVRSATIVNPALPPEAFAVLSQDPSQRVRSLLASRTGLPAGMLAELANDPDGIVSIAARRNPDFNGPVAAHAGLLAD